MAMKGQNRLHEMQEQRLSIQQKAVSSTHKLVQSVQRNTKPFQAFLTKFNNDWSTTFAGLLAYSILMAMLPIAIALVSILGFVLGSRNRDAIIQQVNTIFPGQTAHQNAITLAIDQLSKQAGILAILAVVLAIFGGSRLFIMLESCFSIVYRVRGRPLIQKNLMALGMLILFIILVPLMVFGSMLPDFLLRLMANNPLLETVGFLKALAYSPIITYLTSFAGGLVAAFLLFEAIYMIVPNRTISWQGSWPGALVAAFAVTIFLKIFPLYTQYFMRNYAGQIGFAVVLLLFFYYFAIILMLGAEVNAFFRDKVQPMPNDLATYISTIAENGMPGMPEHDGMVHPQGAPTDQADKDRKARLIQN
jgi:YihY family inner membrane protein